MQPISRAALIINTRSRKGAEAFETACVALKAHGITLAAFPIEDPDQLEGAVREAIAGDPEALILGGGDGTISGLVDHLVGTRIKLGLLPLGTANSFARSLGLPFDLEEAVAVIARGHCRRIDLGMIDSDYFANCAAMGLSPMIARTIPSGFKKWGGRLGYALWALIQMLRFRPFMLTIEKDGTRESLSALEVRIANGSYHGGTELVTSAEVDSGEIVVQVVEGKRAGVLMLSWLLSILGLHARDATTREFRGRALGVSAHPLQPISIDGEVLAKTPVTAKVAPGVIEVFVPQS